MPLVEGDKKLPCFCCATPMPIGYVGQETKPNVTDNGVMCEVDGNYGSRVLDQTDGSFIFFVICDECLSARFDRVLAFSRERILPQFNYTQLEVEDVMTSLDSYDEVDENPLY